MGASAKINFMPSINADVARAAFALVGLEPPTAAELVSEPRHLVTLAAIALVTHYDALSKGSSLNLAKALVDVAIGNQKTQGGGTDEFEERLRQILDGEREYDDASNPIEIPDSDELVEVTDAGRVALAGDDDDEAQPWPVERGGGQ